MSQDVTTWQAPQEKTVRSIIKWGSVAAIAFIGAFTITKVAPTFNSALNLIGQLTDNMIHIGISVGILMGLYVLLNQIYSKNGLLNKLAGQAYSSFIHRLTTSLLDIDPITPLLDSQAQAQAQKDVYDKQFAQFDGVIQKFNSDAEDFETQAKKATDRARAAKNIGDVEAFNRLAYEAGSDNETAKDMRAKAAQLEQFRTIIVRLQSAAGDLIYKLGIDINSTRARWAAAQSMTKMGETARNIIGAQQRDAMTQEAMNIVNTKYASALGGLRNLNDVAKPLLESIDLDHATYNQQLLDQFEKEDATHTLTITKVSSVPMAQIDATSSADTSVFANLIQH